MAQAKMGEYYIHGINVKQDITKAKEWLTKAAKNANPQAIFALGLLALKGIGEDVDEKKGTLSQIFLNISLSQNNGICFEV